MKKAKKVLYSFFKKADCDDGNDSGATSVLTDLSEKEYKEPTEDAKRGLHSEAGPYSKTKVCRGAGCSNPTPTLFCDNCSAKSKAGDLTTKPPQDKIQYVDKHTQNQIWKQNKSASKKVLDDFFNS